MCTMLSVFTVMVLSFCCVDAKRTSQTLTKDEAEDPDAQHATVSGDGIVHVLPSKPTKRMQPASPSQVKGGSVLLEDSGNASALFEESACDPSSAWTIVKYIAKGTQGTVYKVERTIFGKASRPYLERRALKVPNSPANKEDVIAEASIMRSSRSKGVMPLLESDPCLQLSVRGTILPPGWPRGFRGAGRLRGSYLTTLMEGDFLFWLQQASSARLKRCREMIVQQLMSALSDLHDRKFVHGDLKSDNILWESISTDLDTLNCPVGMRLTDFGLSGKLGAQDWKYEGRHYYGSNHLPGCIFEGRACDMSGVDAGPVVQANGDVFEVYVRDRRIDMCSLKSLSQDVFGYAPTFKYDHDPPDLRGKTWGSCGPMGRGRYNRIDLP